MFTYLFGISRRWEMMLLLCSGVFVVYTLRVNISVAAPKMAEDLGWSERDKGLVLSAFYWGYAAGQIPASRFAQVYGAKTIFGLSILIPSILTLMVPLACRTSLPVALTVRCLLGFFESASFPAVFHFYPIWIPPAEKTIMVTVINLGMYIGEIVGFSLSGALIESVLPISGYDFGDWPSVFYVFGILGILWYPFWLYFAYESPDVHPYITQGELILLQSTTGYSSGNSTQTPLLNDAKFLSQPNPFEKRTTNANNYQYLNNNDEDDDSNVVNFSPIVKQQGNYSEATSDKMSSRDHSSAEVILNPSELAKRTPWLKFFTHKESLTLFVVNFVYGFIGFMLLSEMPSYLNSQLGFDIASAGELCIVPYAALFCATLAFGKLFDYLQHQRSWEVRSVRQWAQFIALGGSVSFLLICGFTPSSERILAFTMLVIAQALLGVSQSGLGCAYLDLAPRFSSSMNSVGNTIGAIAGILGPILVADFTERYPGVWGWRYIFILTSAMSAFSLILWYFFQSSRIHPELNTPLRK